MMNQQNQTKKAFFIIGPESSGTRMMTQAFIALGAYGDGGHQQKLSKEGFGGGHPMIAVRRSVPHGVKMPDITQIIKELRKHGYQVFPIIIVRDKDKCAASQLKNGHAKTLQEAKDSIKTSVNFIHSHLANFPNLYAYFVQYEPFTKKKKIRDSFFKKFGFPHPEMDFYDGNAKYK